MKKERFLDRRGFVSLLGGGCLGLVAAPRRGGSDDRPVITFVANYALGLWHYEPVGLYLRPCQTVRWEVTKWGASVTAFHPDHDNHELRIPEGAVPFDSGIMGQQINSVFEWTFEVEGTYDFFSRNHEVVGTVGRIVVGQPGGPGEEPLGYGSPMGRAPIFERAREVFDRVPSSRIVQEKMISYPRAELQRRYPY